MEKTNFSPLYKNVWDKKKFFLDIFYLTTINIYTNFKDNKTEIPTFITQFSKK